MCSACWAALVPAAPRRLEGVASLIALFEYDRHSASVILRAKNGGGRPLLRRLGEAMARAIDAVDSVGAIDAVTWVPASRSHERDRGYDQGRLLARPVAAALGVPARNLLRRVDEASQQGRGRTQRLDGAVLVARRPVGGRLVLVDDVVTTGASLEHGACALIAAGADTIHAAVVASVTRDGPDRVGDRPYGESRMSHWYP